MIQIKNVSKDFDDVKALKDVNLNIKKGSIYGLIGSNGAGKTTLLKILAGIYKEDTGEISIENEKVFENEEIKLKTFFIPDSLYYFSQYTIRDMAHFYKSIYSTWNDERYEKLKNVFKIDINKRVNSLSKGMWDMKSKISFLNKGIFINDIKRFGWIGVVHTLVLFFFVPLQILMNYDSIKNFNGYNPITNIFHFRYEIHPILMVIVPTLTGIFLFLYIYSKKSVDLFHTLPVKRESLYNSHILKGKI